MYNSFENKKPPVKKNDLFKFEPLAKRINRYLQMDGITLSFEGYRDTVYSYFKMEDNHITQAYELMTECNLWWQYFADLEGIVQNKLLDIELDLDILIANYDKSAPDSSMENKINDITQIRKDFKAFLSQMNVQKVFFNKAYYHCSNIYNKGMNALNYKILD